MLPPPACGRATAPAQRLGGAEPRCAPRRPGPAGLPPPHPPGSRPRPRQPAGRTGDQVTRCSGPPPAEAGRWWPPVAFPRRRVLPAGRAPWRLGLACAAISSPRAPAGRFVIFIPGVARSSGHWQRRALLRWGVPGAHVAPCALPRRPARRTLGQPKERGRQRGNKPLWRPVPCCWGRIRKEWNGSFLSL